MNRCSRLLVGLAASVATATAQQAQENHPFEVASVRPGAAADAELIPIRMKVERSRIHYVNVSLRDCIRVAYGVKDFQISGPGWIGNRFNIDAKYPAGVTEDQVPQMLQALLQDRFKLQVHRATKEHAVYALVVGRSGPKLKPTELTASDFPDSLTRRPGTPVYGNLQILGDPSGMRLKGPAVTMSTLAETLSGFTNEPVVDQTGLVGRYDLDLFFLPEERLRMHGSPGGPEPGGAADPLAEPPATVFDAVQKYGLRLEASKAPMKMLVVDHLEKTPTEN